VGQVGFVVPVRSPPGVAVLPVEEVVIVVAVEVVGPKLGIVDELLEGGDQRLDSRDIGAVPEMSESLRRDLGDLTSLVEDGARLRDGRLEVKEVTRKAVVERLGDGSGLTQT
jgi:hypothetical protein